MKIVSKITLAATFGLALACTFSCSGDDDKGGWLTCEKLHALDTECYSKYTADETACKSKNDNEREICYDAVEAKIYKCIEDTACNGVPSENCALHFPEDCPVY